MAHRVSSRARADLDNIWHHVVVESGSESAADGIVDLIADRFLLLSDWPRLGRARNDLRRGLRSFPVGDYVIFTALPEPV
jgi:toxin ParE1/3/4